VSCGSFGNPGFVLDVAIGKVSGLMFSEIRNKSHELYLYKWGEETSTDPMPGKWCSRCLQGCTQRCIRRWESSRLGKNLGLRESFVRLRALSVRDNSQLSNKELVAGLFASMNAMCIRVIVHRSARWAFKESCFQFIPHMVELETWMQWHCFLLWILLNIHKSS